MIQQNKLNDQGLEEYPAKGIFLENAVLLLWIIFGTIACWFFYPIVAWVYLGYALVMVLFVLRKLLCTKCYYYGKWCHVGWGKLAAIFFKKGDLDKFNYGCGQKIVPIFYGSLVLVPLVLIIINLIKDFTEFKLLNLILLFVSVFISSVILRKSSCAQCKMKNCCNGCAVK